MKAGIVGAGIMGQLLALALYQAGWQVTIYDANEAENNNCSQVAAGLLTPLAELERTNLSIYHLGCEALDTHWPQLISSLFPDIYFYRKGSFVLSHPKDKAELELFIRQIKSKYPTANYESLTSEKLATLEPSLKRFENVLYLPEEGQIDNQAMLKALQKYLRKQKVSWHFSTFVEAIKPYQLKIKNTWQRFDMVFDCRGLGARDFFHSLQSIRGELLWLEAKEVSITRPIRFLHPRYALYLVPRPNHLYIVGASEIAVEDYSSISVRTTLELLTAAYSLHPGFAEARMIKTATHCRPTFPDYLSRIYYADGMIAVNGLYRHGFLIAPSIVVEIMRYLAAKNLRYQSLWQEYNDHHTI